MTDPEETVRIAALETLARIGGGASVPVLLRTALDSSGATQKAASAALVKISGPNTSKALAMFAKFSDPASDPTFAKLSREADAKSRATAIHALADRNDTTALPALVRYASDPDPVVSEAACAALGRLGTDQEIEGLGQLVLDDKTPGAEAALHAVASRASDKGEAARRLVQLSYAAKGDQAKGMAALFKTLPVLGGSAGLSAVSQAIFSTDAVVRDAAIRALANWPDFAATKALLKIAAADDTTQVHNVLAVQGVVRLIKSSDREPAPARLAAAQGAWAAAKRTEEKKQVLSALASIPLAKSAEIIRPLLGDANFKTEAGLAGVALADALLKADKPAAKSLAQAIKDAGISDEISRNADAVLKK